MNAAPASCAFDDAVLTAASPDDVDTLRAATSSPLDVGQLTSFDGVHTGTAAAYVVAAEGIRVLGAADHGDGEPLRVRWSDLGIAGGAATLQPDPMADRDEYNALLHLALDPPTQTVGTVGRALEVFGRRSDPVFKAVGKRGQDLQVVRMAA